MEEVDSAVCAYKGLSIRSEFVKIQYVILCAISVLIVSASTHPGFGKKAVLLHTTLWQRLCQ